MASLTERGLYPRCGPEEKIRKKRKDNFTISVANEIGVMLPLARHGSWKRTLIQFVCSSVAVALDSG